MFPKTSTNVQFFYGTPDLPEQTQNKYNLFVTNSIQNYMRNMCYCTTYPLICTATTTVQLTYIAA